MMPSPHVRWLRVGVLVLVMAALFVAAKLTGLSSVRPAEMRAMIVGAGAAGVFIYVGAFVVGELLHVPGLMFVAVGVAIWGRVWGSMLGWGTALLSVAASFVIVRAIGGEAIKTSKVRWVQRLLTQLELHPVRTTALIRAVVPVAPTITCLLALTPIRFSRMVLGSAIGLFVPITLVTIFVRRALVWFGP